MHSQDLLIFKRIGIEEIKICTLKDSVRQNLSSHQTRFKEKQESFNIYTFIF